MLKLSLYLTVMFMNIGNHSCPVKLGYYKMSQLRCSVFLSDVVVLQIFSNRVAVKLAAKLFNLCRKMARRKCKPHSGVIFQNALKLLGYG